MVARNKNNPLVELHALVYGGDAIGRLEDGRICFVSFGLPGELVEIKIIEEHKNHARGEILRILKPAASRIEPRCRHFGICGGCHYQHMTYEEQLQTKQRILAEQLQRFARLSNPPVQPIIPSPSAWNYRNTVQFHLSDNGKLGFQQIHIPQTIEIQECHLPEETINQVWPCVQIDPSSGVKEAALRTGSGQDILLVLKSDSSRLPEFSVDFPISAVYITPNGSTVLSGDEYIVMSVCGKLFRVSASSFFQVNTAQTEKLVQVLLQMISLENNPVVLELYSGVGLFTAFLAEQASKCLAIEISPSACSDFVWNMDRFDNVSLYMGSAEQVLTSLEIDYANVIVVDPPRAGLSKLVLYQIEKLHPNEIAYISCDPATLARDIRHLMAAGYRLEEITPIDLFPQTYHIESISLLRKTPA